MPNHSLKASTIRGMWAHIKKLRAAGLDGATASHPCRFLDGIPVVTYKSKSGWVTYLDFEQYLGGNLFNRASIELAPRLAAELKSLTVVI
jgi:hypothetical protein